MKNTFLFVVLLMVGALMLQATQKGESDREAQAKRRAAPKLIPYLGSPVFIRIIKAEYLLELWVQSKEGWKLWKTYPIAAMSGHIGPKEREGDLQAPEGFYRVSLSSLNPRSRYYLSFNIGYPNQYDRSLGRTGSHIMVHGSNVSIGCFAMTDPGIEEIYTMVAEALRTGQSYVPVQIYPFRMTEERLKREKNSPYYPTWQRLLPAWQHTESRHEPWPDKDN